MLTITPEDTRKLIRTVRSNYNLDLSEYGFNLLRYRVSVYLGKHLIKDTGNLINRLLDDETCVDEFLSGISAGSSELFRDPVMWKHLRTQIIPELFSDHECPVFWLPRSVSGHDAFSLVILLAEDGYLNQCRIFSSTSNFADLKKLQAGKLDQAFMNLNRENYHKAGGKKNLDDYFNGSREQIKSVLNRKIAFTRHYNMLHDAPGKVNLIMIRNQLLNFTGTVRTNLIINLIDILSSGGIFVLGVKEVIGEQIIEQKYDTVCIEESIYRKKL